MQQVVELGQGNLISLINEDAPEAVILGEGDFPFSGDAAFPDISIERSTDPVADLGSDWEKSDIVDVSISHVLTLIKPPSLFRWFPVYAYLLPYTILL